MLPLKTIKEGDKITKICVEDVYKTSNRIIEGLDKEYNSIINILNSIHKEYDDCEGELIIGTGISKPCGEDIFNEEIGNEIAFKKAKLNANLKRVRLLERCMKEVINFEDIIVRDLDKVYNYVYKDLKDLRKYNPDYLSKLDYYEI